MKYSTQEKSPQSFVDELRRAEEFSRYEELYRAQELYKNPELFRAEELQEPKKKSLVDKKKTEQERNVKLLSQYVAGIATVTAAAVVTLVGAIVLPTSPAPSFAIDDEEIGLTSFQCNVDVKNPDGLAFHAVLTDAEGQALGAYSLSEDGTLLVEDLLPETEYALCILDEQGQEHFSYSFTTAPFVTLTYLEEGNAAMLTLHESLNAEYDLSLKLYDGEGKDFSSNLYIDLLPGAEPPTDSDSSFDSTVDSAPEIPTAYYLAFDGLYIGEYTLSATQYLPDDEELTYEKKLHLGTLQSLQYEVTVDGEEEEIVFQYLSGELGAYQLDWAELIQDELYYYVDAQDIRIDGNEVYISIPPEWERGTYTLYLGGSIYTNEQNYYNQIFKCTVII